MPVFVGIDVAKTIHWVCAVDQDARVLVDRAVENDQAALDALAAELRALAPELSVGLDVTGSIATFLEAVLLAEGFALVHVPGIAVNRAGHGFAGGERKSDPRDARTIAELVRTRADLRPISHDDETTIAIRLKVGRRRDLVAEQTSRLARLRQLLAQIHPGLERGLEVTAKGPLALLTRYVTPGEIRKAGRRRLAAHLRKTPHLRRVDALADQALAAAREQTVAVPGEGSIAELIRELATEALTVRARIAQLDRDLAALLRDHPDGALIQSLPGMGAVLAAEFVAAAGNPDRFRSPDALAAAAGLAPVLRQSGKSRTLRRAFGGDKALKRVFFQSAFCAVTAGDPLSKAFYERKRAEGKHHKQALIALARRRATVLWTMLKRRSTFDRQRYAA